MLRMASGVDLLESMPRRDKGTLSETRKGKTRSLLELKRRMTWGKVNVSNLSALKSCCSLHPFENFCRPKLQPGHHLWRCPDTDAPLKGSWALGPVSKGRWAPGAGLNVLGDLGTLCWACRQAEAQAHLDLPEDAAVVVAAADASRPQQKENLSDALTCGQTSPLKRKTECRYNTQERIHHIQWAWWQQCDCFMCVVGRSDVLCLLTRLAVKM